MCHSRNERKWCQCATCCNTANNYHASRKSHTYLPLLRLLHQGATRSHNTIRACAATPRPNKLWYIASSSAVSTSRASSVYVSFYFSLNPFNATCSCVVKRFATDLWPLECNLKTTSSKCSVPPSVRIRSTAASSKAEHLYPFI